MRMPARKELIGLGRMAERAYDEVEKALERAASENPRIEPESIGVVDAGIGRTVWRTMAALRHREAGEPDDAVLARIGGRATVFIDAADRGRVGGTVDDVHRGIGYRLLQAYDEETARMDAVAAAEAAPAIGGPR